MGVANNGGFGDGFMKDQSTFNFGCAEAMAFGMSAIEKGLDLFVPGEMGIGNTTGAAAIALALYSGEAVDVTLDLYGCSHIRVLTSNSAKTVLVDGNQKEFEFDFDTRVVTVNLHGGKNVRILT